MTDNKKADQEISPKRQYDSVRKCTSIQQSLESATCELLRLHGGRSRYARVLGDMGKQGFREARIEQALDALAAAGKLEIQNWNVRLIDETWTRSLVEVHVAALGREECK